MLKIGQIRLFFAEKMIRQLPKSALCIRSHALINNFLGLYSTTANVKSPILGFFASYLYMLKTVWNLGCNNLANKLTYSCRIADIFSSYLFFLFLFFNFSSIFFSNPSTVSIIILLFKISINLS